ncbi:hypothetical protein CAEBREN_05077 [Caenorhabditis brenneri]|uniref:Sdz-33 F-box domain-containing protein n=1 Tax=Caenorhabditis brenneri TaxID=135651 RepID=G0NSM9_CAEBE|nr:hypothetical protein CAEBREN_05077 [Caenorhabditis brenneri]
MNPKELLIMIGQLLLLILLLPLVLPLCLICLADACTLHWASKPFIDFYERQSVLVKKWWRRNNLPKTFKFRKLPALVRIEILKLIDDRQLLELSLHYKAFKRELQMKKLDCEKLKINIRINCDIKVTVSLSGTVLNFHFHSSSYYELGWRLRKKLIAPFTIKDNDFYVKIDKDLLLQHFLDVMSFQKAKEVTGAVEVSPEVLNSNVWNLPINFSSIHIICPGENVEFILQHVKTRRLILSSDFSELSPAAFSFCEVELHGKFNLSFAHFDESVVQRIKVRSADVSLKKELNNFFKQWIAGGFPKLMELDIIDSQRQENWSADTLLDGIESELVLELSLHCKAFKRELQQNKITCKKIEVNLPDEPRITIHFSQNVLNFIFHSCDTDGLKWQDKTTLKKLVAAFTVKENDFRVKIDPKKESPTEFFDIILQHFTDVMDFRKAEEITASVNFPSEQLSSKFWNLPINCTTINITCPLENLDFVLQHLKAERVILKSDFSNAPSGVLKLRDIGLSGPINISFSHFDQSVVERIQVDQPCVSLVQELNNFLKLWIEGGFFPNLISLNIRESMPSATVILDEIECEAV